MKPASLIPLIFLALTLSVLPSCGGGGGGGGGGGPFSGAADLRLRATPDNIDTGDRIQIRVEIQDVHPNGIVLKLRYPNALSYVIGTAFLEVRRDEIDTGPTINASRSNNTFLVFFLSQALFGERNEGELVIELAGVAATDNGEISVDADVNDLNVDDDEEFNLANPNFVSEDSLKVDVRDRDSD